MLSLHISLSKVKMTYQKSVRKNADFFLHSILKDIQSTVHDAQKLLWQFVLWRELLDAQKAVSAVPAQCQRSSLAGRGRGAGVWGEGGGKQSKRRFTFPCKLVRASVGALLARLALGMQYIQCIRGKCGHPHRQCMIVICLYCRN